MSLGVLGKRALKAGGGVLSQGALTLGGSDPQGGRDEREGVRRKDTHWVVSGTTRNVDGFRGG